MNIRKLIQQVTILINFGNRRIGRWLLAIFLSLAQPFASPAAYANEILEYQVKTAFIYNFMAFTQWPENTAPVINLCLYGENGFGQEIDKLQKRAIGARAINVMRVSDSNQLKHCQAIFFAKSAANSIADILTSLENQPILTLADNPRAIEQGIIINMSLAHEKVVFEINLGVARKSGLNLSSKLLQLAVKVNH